jgi:hypothetical protein
LANPEGEVITGAVNVLFVSVAVAEFLVASDVLSTFPKPTSLFVVTDREYAAIWAAVALRVVPL